MYDFVRLSGFGRLRGVGHGSKVAGQHHRHASPDRLLADGMGKAALGQGYLGFLSKQHGLLFVPPGVALMLYFDVIAAEFWPIFTATVVSTVLVLVVTGHVHQWVRRHGVFRK